MTTRRWCDRISIAALLLLASLAPLRAAQAQFFGGLDMFLNPEGSRLFPQTIVFPRHPGKPDLRWKSFQWRFTDRKASNTEYRLFFYNEEDWAAQFTLPRIDEHIKALETTFKYTPSKKFSYVLFTSNREFQQANIFHVTEGVQGITSTQEPTMAIPYWGDTATFDHISKHEMVHQFQVQKDADLKKDQPNSPGLTGASLWFIEGMAEYYSLGGIDPETKTFIRDLLINENTKDDYKVPKFLEEGPMSFLGVYKVGQAKIDFIEKDFGPGMTQSLLEAVAKKFGAPYVDFKSLLVGELKRTPEELEKAWTDYLNRTYKAEPIPWKQKVDAFEEIKDIGETIDYFDLSQDGNLFLYRQVDPMVGLTQIRLFDRKNKQSFLVTEDNQPGALSLYFMQGPSLTLSQDWVAYGVETANGPVIEARRILRNENGVRRLGREIRLEIHQLGLLQATSVAISPDQKQLALVGVEEKGWTNIYVVDGFLAKGPNRMRKITQDHYHWETLSWSDRGLIAASDRTVATKHDLFKIDPSNGALTQLLRSPENQENPEWHGETLVYQSWQSGAPQVHLIQGEKELRLTDIATGMKYPKIRGDDLYAMTMMGGKFKVYRITKDKWLNLEVGPAKLDTPPSSIDKPWTATLASLPPDSIRPYSAFKSTGIRIDNLAAFIGGGSTAGIFASVSDLMRNYSVIGSFSTYGGFDNNSASLFLSSQKGRATWTVGGYHTLQPRLDTMFLEDMRFQTYLQREFGLLGAVQYPLAAFTYIDLSVRAGAVKRTDFDDPLRLAEWNSVNPGNEPLLAPVLRLGYDRILYEAYTGPLKGFGILLEGETQYFPHRDSFTERLRLDVANYTQLLGTRTVLSVRALGGAAFGRPFRNSLFVSSDDLMRGYFFGDQRLFGNYVLASQAELRFPIGSLFGFPPLRGLAAYDIGSVFQRGRDLGSRISSAYTGGLTLNIPPLSINLMMSYPLRVAPGPIDSSVFHFTFRYLYI